MFGCALNYTTMRLLGVPSDDPVLVKARKLLHDLGNSIRTVLDPFMQMKADYASIAVFLRLFAFSL